MQGKCNILKPVDVLTGNFFTFSQYAQDLTKQYSQPNTYRCLPSKFVSLNLDYSKLSGTTETELSVELGNIFQNYFENSCAFLRSEYGNTWEPEYTRTLLFQTLEKYNLITLNTSKALQIDGGELDDGTTAESNGYTSGVSDEIKYIGDINIYSNNSDAAGIGYNEIYCYIPNDAKCKDYQLSAVAKQSSHIYTSTKIFGFEGEAPYNGLEYEVDGYADKTGVNNCYGVGSYTTTDGATQLSLVPMSLTSALFSSDDSDRKIPEEEQKKFEINAIIVLYDIVQVNTDSTSETVLHSNIPMGIFFTGSLDINKKMSNTIIKYVNNDAIYNQGTAYGLRICNRFLAVPNSNVTIETSVSASNIAELAPVMEQMSDTLTAVNESLDNDKAMQQMLQDHLSNFKNNKVNVPYVRQLGNKKYWFVNGKNTGAIAQYEMSSKDDIVKAAYDMVLQDVYTKNQVDTLLSNKIDRTEFESLKDSLISLDTVQKMIDILEQKLLTYLQNE